MGPIVFEEHKAELLADSSCPKCGSSDVRRSHSSGARAAVARLFGRVPFRCRSCRARFFRMAVGSLKQEHQNYAE